MQTRRSASHEASDNDEVTRLQCGSVVQLREFNTLSLVTAPRHTISIRRLHDRRCHPPLPTASTGTHSPASACVPAMSAGGGRRLPT